MERNDPLTYGKCDFCDNPAQIPWKNAKFCYPCWTWFWQKLTRETGEYYDQTENKEITEAREKEIARKQKEKNGIRRAGKGYVNFNF